MTEESGIELKNCPLCGSASKIYEGSYIMIHCMDCACGLSLCLEGDDRTVEEHVTQWNKRA